MQTELDFYLQFRERFAGLAISADRLCTEQWGEFGPELAYSWFECLANAMNGKMQRQLDVAEIAAAFEYIAGVLPGAGKSVRSCIDVAFVENLFWQVSRDKAQAYWAALPEPLKAFYLGFHPRPPVA